MDFDKNVYQDELKKDHICQGGFNLLVSADQENLMCQWILEFYSLSLCAYVQEWFFYDNSDRTFRLSYGWMYLWANLTQECR